MTLTAWLNRPKVSQSVLHSLQITYDPQPLGTWMLIYILLPVPTKVHGDSKNLHLILVPDPKNQESLLKSLDSSQESNGDSMIENSVLLVTDCNKKQVQHESSYFEFPRPNHIPQYNLSRFISSITLRFCTLSSWILFLTWERLKKWKQQGM
jgi:hypothetical protein